MQKEPPFPYYPLVFSAFPVLTLMANNTAETHFSAIFRPLTVSFLASGFLFGLIYFIFRKNWHKSGLVTGLTVLGFFSYGHVFNLVQSIPFLTQALGRHRFLFGLYSLVWIGAWIAAALWDIKPEWTKLMNAFSIVLIALPILQIGWFYISEAVADVRLTSQQAHTNYQEANLAYFPDIYYIILDTYARPDALLEDYDIDVMDFVASMEELGFYFASESQSNYGETFSSLTSSLNMMYVDSLANNLKTTQGSPTYQNSIKNNRVKKNLEDRGYKTIAFSTGYRWSEITDSDIFFYTDFTSPLQSLTSFEALLFKTTILYPFRGYLNIDPSGSVYSAHIQAQRMMIETLPIISDDPEPTFTFAHFLVPHVPFIFDSDGTLLTDPGYFSGEDNGAINKIYRIDGYGRQISFINNEIVKIVNQILTQSEEAPIIIIQGDHGFEGDNRFDILNLYYFPDQDYDLLYKSITPVNSFRVVLSQYFGMDYSLLADRIFRD